MSPQSSQSSTNCTAIAADMVMTFQHTSIVTECERGLHRACLATTRIRVSQMLPPVSEFEDHGCTTCARAARTEVPKTLLVIRDPGHLLWAFAHGIARMCANACLVLKPG